MEKRSLGEIPGETGGFSPLPIASASSLESDRESRLHRHDPWKLFDQYVVAQRWKPKFDASKAKVEKMVVWARVPGIPIEYFREDAIKEILAIVGTQLKLDMTTAGVQRGKFARGAVEIDLTKPLVAVVMVDDLPWNVEFEGLHAICFDCGEVGHRSATCPKNQKAAGMEQGIPQEEGMTDNMDVEDPQTPTPIAKHGAWMIVKRKSKGSDKGLGKQRGKSKGEVKTSSMKSVNGSKAAQTSARTGTASGDAQLAGIRKPSVHTATNLAGSRGIVGDTCFTC
ncbi:uncharacterized protein LOC116031768 [Ipomoea triloba]|uniref:uncharacterized protein LOC116031768 n=1 Tax=Ipomoea triloba TaxID=35885 RepID=UPI00125E826F|nr:uncharacterized protein LOC116031768 [Ipomoea triloba]